MLDILLDKVKELIKSRMFLITLIYIALVSILVHRNFTLQIIEGETYEQKYESTMNKQRDIKSTRGNIYDAKGRLLAYNVVTYSVKYVDSDLISKNEDKNQMLNKLIQIIEENGNEIDCSEFGLVLTEDGTIDFRDNESGQLRFKKEVYSNSKLTKEQKEATAEEVFEYLRSSTDSSSPKFEISEDYTLEEAYKIMALRFSIFMKRYKKYIPVPIASDVNEVTVATIKENSDILPGVTIEEETSRVYNSSVSMAHILGYTGSLTAEYVKELEDQGVYETNYTSTDQVGKGGIEKEFESILHGVKGYDNITLNENNRVLAVELGKEPQAGGDVHLTIDSELQDACYELIEMRLASILYDKIIPGSRVPKVDSTKDLKIPITDVYYALINNSVVDISQLNEKDATETEKKVYNKFIEVEKNVYHDLKKALDYSNTKVNESYSEDMNEYLDYIYSMLKSHQIIVSDLVNTKDEAYVNYKNGKISLSQYLQHALGKEWIDRSKFSDSEEYYSSEEIYRKLIEYTFELLEKDSNFNKKLYENLVYSQKITGTEICLLLFDQGMLEYDKEAITNLKSGRISPYNFIKSKIKSREITPAQLALDPCSGSIVITDVKTGKVKALVSYPSYDNNMLANSIDATYYSGLTNSKSLPLINRPTQQLTAPGSTYKMLLGVAGLSEDVIGIHNEITCKGIFTKITPYAKCWKYPRNHGSLNLTEALEVSCNCYFYEVGYRLSIDPKGNYNSPLGLSKIAKYAKEFGLAGKTGIELPEYMPNVSDDSSVRSAIGQGTNNYAPAQLSKYVTGIANSGNIYDLSVVDKVTDAEGKTMKTYEPKIFNQVSSLSKAEWDSIHKGMYLVVNSQPSSLNKVFKDLNVKVAGKTGTAQQVTTRADHALFTSYAPYENPEISVTCVIPNGYTSANAAALAKDVYQYYYDEEGREAQLGKDLTKLEEGVTNTED